MNPLANKTPEQRREIAARSHETARRNRESAKAARDEARAGLTALNRELAEARQARMAIEQAARMSDLAVKLCSKYLLTETEIVARADVPTTSGVYFLVKAGRVIYVGQSTNVFARLSAHAAKDWDRMAYVPCDAVMLDRLESLYIHTLNPPLNGGAYNHHNGKSAPLTLAQLLKLGE
jgi:hypothetical protein